MWYIKNDFRDTNPGGPYFLTPDTNVRTPESLDSITGGVSTDDALTYDLPRWPACAETDFRCVLAANVGELKRIHAKEIEIGGVKGWVSVSDPDFAKYPAVQHAMHKPTGKASRRPNYSLSAISGGVSPFTCRDVAHWVYDHVIQSSLQDPDASRAGLDSAGAQGSVVLAHALNLTIAFRMLGHGFVDPMTTPVLLAECDRPDLVDAIDASVLENAADRQHSSLGQGIMEADSQITKMECFYMELLESDSQQPQTARDEDADDPGEAEVTM